MSPREQSNQSKQAKSGKAPANTVSPGLEPVPKQTADSNAMLQRAKLFPQKLSSAEIQHLQRTVGNLAVSRLLVSKNQTPAIQKKDADPFGKLKHPDKGVHDYRLYANYDPAPKGWKKERTKEGVDYYQKPSGEWELSHPVELHLGMRRYAKDKFRDHIRELQQKLQVALGGKRKSGIRSVDGRFGFKTRRAVRRFQKAEKMPESGIATYDTWEKLDQRGSEGVKFGRVEYETEEELVGSTTGKYGGMASYGWSATDKKMEVVVNVQFTNLPGEGPNVAKHIQKWWNTFKLTYKKDKDGKKTRTKDTSIDLDFVLKPTGGKKGPAVFPNNQVLLWRGDHPNWKNRGGDEWSDLDKKTRSDAGNWWLEDTRLEEMVGHEFGHLIGLDDEYARSHKDIMTLTGGVPMGTTDKEKLTPEQEAKYTSLVGAVTAANDIDSLKKANTTAWKMNETPYQVEFLAQEYKKKTTKKLGRTFRSKVVDVYKKSKKELPSVSDLLTTNRKEREAGNKLSYHQLLQHIRDRNAKEARLQWEGKFPDGGQRGAWWNLWSSSSREYVTGGLMGDFSQIGAKKPEIRPNAVALTHKHPLEPRHVRRFAEYVSRYNNEVWEAEYR